MTKLDIKLEEEAINTLKSWIKAGDTLYTALNHVSTSGMFRLISVFAMVENEPINIDWYIEKLGQYKRDKKRDGLRVYGCGMDMGFSVVYNLSSILYPEYECLELKGKRCPSNFHVNSRIKGSTEPLHKDGYAVSQKWL